MKKLLIILSLFVFTAGCNSNNTSDKKVTKSDTTGAKNPDGIVNSNVISTDTGAWKIDSTGKEKKDSANKR